LDCEYYRKHFFQLQTKSLYDFISKKKTTTKARSLSTAAETCSGASYTFPVGLNNFIGDPGFSSVVGITSRFSSESVHLETPIAIRAFSYIDSAAWNCIAAYNIDKRDALYKDRRPVIEVPETVCNGTVNTHTTGARSQCFLNVYATLVPVFFIGLEDIFQSGIQFLSTNFTTSPPSYTGAYPLPFPMNPPPDVAACDDANEDYNDFKNCLQQVAADHEYLPRVVGSAIALDVVRYAKNDGWNMDGTNNGHCETNCRPFADTSGYNPVNIPGTLYSRLYKRRWQPLLEDNGLGFFYRQEHVTPHIGTRGVPRLHTRQEIDARRIPNPLYNYVREAEKVVDRMASVLVNDTAKMEIEYFDDKINVVGLLGAGIFGRYGGAVTMERSLLWSVGYSAAEYDSVLMAWKEKVRHDLVRTTTVIQERHYRTPSRITTWSGPGKGVQTFPAGDFQPYIRVMPHAEYPSGSACICTAETEATQAYMKVVFGDEVEYDAPNSFFTRSRPIPQGSSKVEPGITPAEDVTLSYTSLKEIRDACGESRLNGGMHFEDAVPEGYKLCSGFAPKVETYLQYLLNGTSI